MEEKSQKSVSLALVSEQSLQPAPDPLSWLTESEKYAYDVFLSRLSVGGYQNTQLSEDAANRLWRSFLAGRSLADIQRTSPQFSLGSIVHCAIRDNWNTKRLQELEFRKGRAEYLKSLAECAVTESLADLSIATRTQIEEAVGRYLQTGDISHLNGVPAGAVSNLKRIQETLNLVSGKVTGSKSEVNVRHSFDIPLEPSASRVPSVSPGKLLSEMVKGK